MTVIPRVALSLAMVIHELTTNGVKYGSLSVPAGQVAVNWRITPRPGEMPLLSIEWQERGGPAVATPTRQGFGSRFIEGSVAAELRGVARLYFDAEGLRCTIDVPLEAAVAVPELE